MLAAGALLAGAGSSALVAGRAWLALTLRGAAVARRPTSFLHLPDMIVTSALIPPLAVFWPLVGAVRYRVRLT